MRLSDYLDKGATLGGEAPCLTMGETDWSYREAQRFSYRLARALGKSGVRPGDKVAILSGNDPVAFACVFGVSRAGGRLVPDQPAQRGCRESLYSRRLRLQRADLPQRLRAAGRSDAPGSAQAASARVSGQFFRSGALASRLARRGRRRATGDRHMRRHRDDRRHGRHDRSAQGRHAQRAQPRGDVCADLDELSIRRTARLSRAGSVDARRWGALSTDHGAGRSHCDPAEG